MRIILTENQLNRLLNEGNFSDELMDEIKQNGWLETSELVGGAENLLSIIGKSKENVINFLMSYFKNLKVERRGNDIVLMGQGLPILQKSSWGYNLIVYRDYLESGIPEKNIPLLRHYIKDFVRELVLRYPQFDSETAEVYKDSGLYQRFGTFDL